MLILNQTVVTKLLTMDVAIASMAEAMTATSKGDVNLPPRIIAPLAAGNGIIAAMPSSCKSLSSYGSKLVSLHPANPSEGRPAVQGIVLLFNTDTGEPVAIVDGASVTGIRTAAASGLATKVLAREDADTLGIMGTGVQAIHHIDAITAVRPIKKILIWGRDLKKAQDLAASQAKRTGFDIAATSDPAEAAACDVVATVTGASEPILKGSWLQEGAHLNLVGAHAPNKREVDGDCMKRSSIFVDLEESAYNEAGEILMAIEENCITKSDVKGEIGAVLNGDIPGRSSSSEITVYKSVGIATQDIFACNTVFELAQKQDIGVSVAW